jgi:hypothetical protein
MHLIMPNYSDAFVACLEKYKGMGSGRKSCSAQPQELLQPEGIY